MSLFAGFLLTLAAQPDPLAGFLSTLGDGEMGTEIKQVGKKKLGGRRDEEKGRKRDTPLLVPMTRGGVVSNS